MKAKDAKQLDARERRALVLWAVECAEHVLPYFEERYPKDNRPRKALEAGRAWVRGEIPMSEVRASAFSAHAAARAAGQAVSTAHVAGHARHAASYAVSAAAKAAVPEDAAAAAAKERNRQYRRLPEHLRPLAFPSQGDS